MDKGLVEMSNKSLEDEQRELVKTIKSLNKHYGDCLKGFQQVYPQDPIPPPITRPENMDAFTSILTLQKLAQSISELVIEIPLLSNRIKRAEMDRRNFTIAIAIIIIIIIASLCN